MATSSIIGMSINNGDRVRYIYCHFDGRDVLDMLNQYYNTEEKVEELIDLGDLSSLGSILDPLPDMEHSYLNRQENVTMSYIRDMGRDVETNSAKTCYSYEYKPNKGEFKFIFIMHLFKDGVWYRYKIMDKSWSED